MLAAKGTLRSQMCTLIVLLIWQMFLKANVDLSGLTNLILTQNIIGSTIKVGMEGGREGKGKKGKAKLTSSSCFFSKVSEQCEDDTASDEEEEGEEGEVYGITTVINLTHHSVSVFSVYTIACIQFHGQPSISDTNKNSFTHVLAYQ